MTKKNPEYDNFNKAMEKILKADPKIVKGAMEAEKRERAKERKAKKESTKK